MGKAICKNLQIYVLGIKIPFEQTEVASSPDFWPPTSEWRNQDFLLKKEIWGIKISTSSVMEHKV